MISRHKLIPVQRLHANDVGLVLSDVTHELSYCYGYCGKKYKYVMERFRQRHRPALVDVGCGAVTRRQAARCRPPAKALWFLYFGGV